MIINSSSKYLPYLKTMWGLCFPDSDEFIALYFSKIYKDDETLVFLEDAMPVASLQMIPYQIRLGHQTFKAAYISGAMTHPLYRRKGYMEKLLLHAFEEMKAKGFKLTFLLPEEDWLFDFYSKLGYSKAFPYSVVNHSIAKDVIPDVRAFALSGGMMDITYLYRSLLAVKDYVVLKSEHQINMIVQDVMMDGGQIFLSPGGLAIAYYKKGKVVIKELLAENERNRRALFYKIGEHYKTNEVMLSQYIPQENSIYRGMIKSLDDSLVVPSDIYMSMMID